MITGIDLLSLTGARMRYLSERQNVLAQNIANAETPGWVARDLRPFADVMADGTGANAGSIRVRPELQRLIEFRTFNLMSPSWASLGDPFDLVFCRNVMIYFDNPTQRKVLEHMHAVMKPGGLLYVGHSENFTESRDLFRLRGKTIYERV